MFYKEQIMSQRLKNYVALFGHIVGTEFTPEELPEMERVADAYQASWEQSFQADMRRNRDAH